MSPRSPAIVTQSHPEDPPATPWEALPTTILERLASENVHGAEDWRALSRARRAAIFGITPAMRRTIDAAAKASYESSPG
ncbi:MAG TPA: hypothetical protein VMD03_07650 [Steroidobacteraceae bacterium]|nr:hypothetical protein [Steroidobacteraceae bacterium]